jgi:sulfatase modifying factor 1
MNAATSWGDLLLFQSLPGGPDQALAAQLLGLPPVRLSQKETQTRNTAPAKPEILAKDEADEVLKGSDIFRPPLRMPHGWAVKQTAAKPQTRLQLPQWNAMEAREVESWRKPSASEQPIAVLWVDLPATVMRCRKALQSNCEIGVHIGRTVNALAQGQWPEPLPKESLTRRVHNAYLLLDKHPERRFLDDDVWAVLHQLYQQFPTVRWRVYEVEQAAELSTIVNHLGQSIWPNQAVFSLAARSLWRSQERRMWELAMLSLTRQGYAHNWLDIDAAPASCTFGHSPDFCTDDLHTLLAGLAVATTVEPALVRALIKALGLRSSLQLEAAVWLHPDLDGGLPFRQWFAQRKQHWLSHLSTLPLAIQQLVGETVGRLHAHCSQVQRDQELLDTLGATGQGIHWLPVEQVALAKERYARVAQHLLKLQPCPIPLANPVSRTTVNAAAAERLQTLPQCFAEHVELKAMLIKAAAIAAQPDAAGTAISSPVQQVAAALHWQANTLRLLPQGVTKAGVSLATLMMNGSWIEYEAQGKRQHHAVTQSADMFLDVVLDKSFGVSGSPKLVRGEFGTANLEAVTRPYWASVFSQSSQGLVAHAQWPDGSALSLVLPQKPGYLKSWQGCPAWLDDKGISLSIAKLLKRTGLAPEHAPALRYIPSGTFLMGSTEGFGDTSEGPRHQVTLTQAQWLAETPCTQALWQAVMAYNPSYSKHKANAPMHPVDNVSFDEVQQFLQRLNTMLPAGVEAVLPTEAQWEYACRASTQSDYWWGNVFDENRAKMDWTGVSFWDPEASTSPVMYYESNHWGLFDMHGNVWEWCADNKRHYTPDPQQNPKGDIDNNSKDRVVRGGSWRDDAIFARASCRWSERRDTRNRDIGFRFALRSSSRGNIGTRGI